MVKAVLTESESLYGCKMRRILTLENQKFLTKLAKFGMFQKGVQASYR